ncbi:hypothetical protein [Nocardia abscessus]|uniref:hypothetical protein n=1 Tax=Nocardia abscessus TaxID=120957 RepID=UPI0024570941|nr:hypothetical protein [Nocardia abscessus]
MHPTTIPFNVATVPVAGGAQASTVRFIYLEHIPYRCVASSMQLFHRPSIGEARFSSPTPAGHVWDSHAAPTGDPVRIRPGDLLTVGGDVFEVHVTEGSGQIFPDLRYVRPAL